MVSVEIPKNDTEPKSDKVSIATSERPATIAGLAEGRIILKKDFFLKNQDFFQVLLSVEIDNEMKL